MPMPEDAGRLLLEFLAASRPKTEKEKAYSRDINAVVTKYSNLLSEQIAVFEKEARAEMGKVHADFCSNPEPGCSDDAINIMMQHVIQRAFDKLHAERDLKGREN